MEHYTADVSVDGVKTRSRRAGLHLHAGAANKRKARCSWSRVRLYSRPAKLRGENVNLTSSGLKLRSANTSARAAVRKQLGNHACGSGHRPQSILSLGARMRAGPLRVPVLAETRGDRSLATRWPLLESSGRCWGCRDGTAPLPILSRRRRRATGSF